MASYSSIEAYNYTLHNYFIDHPEISENKRKKIINAINKQRSKILTIDFKKSDSSEKPSLPEVTRTAYIKSSFLKTKLPIVRANGSLLVPLKFKFIKSKWNPFKKETIGTSRRGAQKAVYPAVDLNSHDDPLQMRLFGWSRIRVADKKQESLAKRNYTSEIEKQKSCAGPDTVRILDTLSFRGSKDHLRLCTLMEWCPNTLSSKAHLMGEEEKLQHAYSLLRILIMLKEKHLIFRDLKGDNLLIDSQNKLKISDFGMAKPIDQDFATFCGTRGYNAPEFLQAGLEADKIYSELKNATSTSEGQLLDRLNALKKKVFTYHIDTWSAGIVLYQLMKGVYPFSGLMADTGFNILNDYQYCDHQMLHQPAAIEKRIATLFTDKSDPVLNLISKMMVTDPTQRASAEDLLVELTAIFEQKGISIPA